MKRPELTRWRVAVFIATVLICAVLPLRAPWPLVIACAVYIVVVMPAIGRRDE